MAVVIGLVLDTRFTNQQVLQEIISLRLSKAFQPVEIGGIPHYRIAVIVHGTYADAEKAREDLEKLRGILSADIVPERTTHR